jgi:hypothetical protein
MSAPDTVPRSPSLALQIALEAARSGLPVFPCRSDKRPAIKGGRGFLDATTEPGEVRALFARAPGATLVGVPTGPRSGFDVLDIDPRHDGHLWEQENAGLLPETRVHTTMGGGRHYLFRHCSGVTNSAGKVAPGVDVRGEGGYIIIPPSPGYEVVEDRPLAPWPLGLLRRVVGRSQPVPRPNGQYPGEVPSEARVRGFVQHQLDRISAAQDGTKHDTLRDAVMICAGLEGVDLRWLAKAALAALPTSVKDWRGAEKTIGWAIEHGVAAPISLEERRRERANGAQAPPDLAPGWSGEAECRAAPRTAAASTLPAYYPAPTDDRDTAKACQDAAMREHLAEVSRNAHARRELHRRRSEAIDAAGGKDALTPGQKAAITRKLHREIAAKYGYGKRLPPPPRHMFWGAQGTGKTTLARQFAAAARGLTTWITELTFEKSIEEYDAYRREVGPDSPPAMLIRGRERSDPRRPGHRMCDRHVAAQHIAEAGLSVPDLLCEKCAFRGKCGDHRQRSEAEALVEADQGAVFFLAGNYVFLAAPAPAPDHAILDETLLRLATQVRIMPLRDLAALSVLNIDTTSVDTRETLRAIVEAFTVPHPTTPARVAAGDERIMPRPLAYLRHAGIDRAALRYLAKSARAELDRQTPDIDASMNDAAIEAALNGGNRRQLRQLLGLISALLTEIGLPRETTTGVWKTTVSGAPALGVARLQPLRGLKHAALTVLDGTGKQSLARKLFGERLAETRILFKRQAHVIGTRGKSYSKQSVTAEDSAGTTISHKAAPAARLRGEIATIYDRLPAGSAICATKRVEDILFDTGAVPPGTPAMHFGALRGRNAWEHCPGGLFVGAENVSIGDIEAIARAFLATDPAPFVSVDATPPKGWRWEHQWPYRATRMRRMRDGSTSPVEVPVHPDPRVQDVLELVREDELVQAIDRLRPVWHRRQAVLLNDLCVDVTYDAIYSHKHLVAGGNPIERAFLATGIVPLSPEDLHHAHPAIFKSPAAAEHVTRNSRQIPNRDPIWACAVVSYRRAGQRGPDARALLDRSRYPDQASVVVAIEAAIGCKLQMYEGVTLRRDDEPPAAGADQRPEPWIAPAPRQPGSGAAPPSILVHGPPDG